jgi:hypothetical protein
VRRWLVRGEAGTARRIRTLEIICKSILAAPQAPKRTSASQSRSRLDEFDFN